MNVDDGTSRTIPAALNAALVELAAATPGSPLMDEVNALVRNAATNLGTDTSWFPGKSDLVEREEPCAQVAALIASVAADYALAENDDWVSLIDPHDTYLHTAHYDGGDWLDWMASDASVPNPAMPAEADDLSLLLGLTHEIPREAALRAARLFAAACHLAAVDTDVERELLVADFPAGEDVAESAGLHIVVTGLRRMTNDALPAEPGDELPQAFTRRIRADAAAASMRVLSRGLERQPGEIYAQLAQVLQGLDLGDGLVGGTSLAAALGEVVDVTVRLADAWDTDPEHAQFARYARAAAEHWLYAATYARQGQFSQSALAPLPPDPYMDAVASDLSRVSAPVAAAARGAWYAHCRTVVSALDGYVLRTNDIMTRKALLLARRAMARRALSVGPHLHEIARDSYCVLA